MHRLIELRDQMTLFSIMLNIKHEEPLLPLTSKLPSKYNLTTACVVGEGIPSLSGAVYNNFCHAAHVFHLRRCCKGSPSPLDEGTETLGSWNHEWPCELPVAEDSVSIIH